MKFLLLALILALPGCGTSTRAEKKVDTTTHEDLSVSGSFKIPWPTATGVEIIDVPVVFKIVREKYEAAKTEATRRSQLDIPELQTALAATIKQLFPVAGAFMAAPKSDGVPTGEIGRIGGEVAALAAILMKMRADAQRIKDAKAEAEFHKADAKEGWTKATEKSET